MKVKRLIFFKFYDEKNYKKDKNSYKPSITRYTQFTLTNLKKKIEKNQLENVKSYNRKVLINLLLDKEHGNIYFFN